ncbi:hypothetical protein K456DRAFT_466012 [Colletotrichum gloeosporioides 23]|nr:hypothetical protein K456DRAFT_466012 [Colletotrichum gloeosporioides 23]
MSSLAEQAPNNETIKYRKCLNPRNMACPSDTSLQASSRTPSNRHRYRPSSPLPRDITAGSIRAAPSRAHPPRPGMDAALTMSAQPSPMSLTALDSHFHPMIFHQCVRKSGGNSGDHVDQHPTKLPVAKHFADGRRRSNTLTTLLAEPHPLNSLWRSGCSRPTVLVSASLNSTWSKFGNPLTAKLHAVRPIAGSLGASCWSASRSHYLPDRA